MTHLLDTSALLTHFLDEPGATEVDELLAGGPSKVAVSILTWVELERRLADLIADPKEQLRVFRLYTEVLTRPLNIDATVAIEAIRLRATSQQHIPLVDCIIAASASCAGLIFVHRDRHMDSIASKHLKITRLPDK